MGVTRAVVPRGSRSVGELHQQDRCRTRPSPKWSQSCVSIPSSVGIVPVSKELDPRSKYLGRYEVGLGRGETRMGAGVDVDVGVSVSVSVSVSVDTGVGVSVSVGMKWVPTYSIFTMLPSSVGREPSRLLYSRRSEVTSVSKPTSEGMVPCWGS